MSPPYNECYNYTIDGFESRDHCYDTCMIADILGHYKKLPFNVRIGLEDGMLNYTIITEEDMKDVWNRVFFKFIEYACRLQCFKPDCQHIDYLPIEMVGTESEVFSITLYAPNEPDLISIEKAKITVIDVITYLLSCLSFWMGFCPLLLISNISTKIRRRIKKRKAKVYRINQDPEIWKRRITDLQRKLDDMSQIVDNVQLHMTNDKPKMVSSQSN
ncbi:hypothetical protein HDE_13203 [Halotydeus destructor]|nr:hypothetical protein HDE_13203 [Halotydeus destructor]